MGCSLLSQCNGWNDIRSIFPPRPVQMCVHTKQLYISADISCIKVWLYAAGTPCRIISYYGYDEKRILILNWKFHSFASISKSPYISTSWIYISISSNWIAVSLFIFESVTRMDWQHMDDMIVIIIVPGRTSSNTMEASFHAHANNIHIRIYNAWTVLYRPAS